ncbi:zinc finger protein 219 isoform X2 [Genypterus blacodes]|uniref:zinc finger protein 219 isoform X2 n=1 Tax=Genypterus blacodes TaxID=154954 RepID=UPI003F769879
MDSPPECVLTLSCEQPQSPTTLPSLDHSPQASSPHTHLSLSDSPAALPIIHSPEPSPCSPDAAPYFPLSPFPLRQDSNSHHHAEEEEDDEEEEELDVPPSPIPAVALFPGGGGQDAGCSPVLDNSPPATPSAPILGFGSLELALSSGQSDSSKDELDLQLFQKDAVMRAMPGGGGASSGPALRFPCHVCGKRFRFQSILSLHARAHSLDRDRRASALLRSGLPSAPLTQQLKVQQNHKDIIQNHRSHLSQRSLPGTLIQHLTEDGEEVDDEVKGLGDGLQPDQNPIFLLNESTPLTPPLTEDPVSVTSPYSSHPPNSLEATSNPTASTFRCHACKGKFRTASELARHVRILHNPYKCTLCPFSASQEESLACHLQESHPSPEVPALPPAYNSRPIIATPDTPVPTPTPTPTPAPTPSAPQMLSATTVAASPALPAFRCDICGQRFTQSWFLKGHMRKHKDSLDHKCQVCGRGFKEPWFLKNHMKVHLNKLGLKAGLGTLAGSAGMDQQAKNNQSLNALYSSLLLAQRGGGGGGRGRSERDPGGRGGMSSGKSAILGYLGLPSDGVGASCMERLQAVAQVAEMGNGGGNVGGSAGGDPGRAGGGSRGAGEIIASVSEGGDQAAWWQLVARSLAVAQQQQRPQQQGQRGPGRSSVITEADQVRAYLGGLDAREEAGGGGGPWECPDCGKLFRSLQQVVVHARVHTQRPQKSGGEEDGGSSRRGGGGGRGNGGGSGGGVSGSGISEARQESQLHGGGSQQAGEARQESKLHHGGSQQAGTAAGFHSVIASIKGENGLTASSSMPSLHSRERVRGRGIKDCPYCGERPYKCPHCDYAGTQSGSLKYHLQRHHREQRNALSASSSSNASSIGGLASGTSGLGKHRRSHLNHAPVSRGLAETPSPRPGQQPWLLGLPDQREHQKALAALRDVDLETQYRYLSGVMGALYQGGMDGGWIRESPPPKAPKVSRRKPLTTSRMVQPSNESSKGGPALPRQEGGFEPLDLSRRPSPGLVGAEEDGVMSVGEGGSVGGGVKLSQCLFCPFRTSSAELMAMHLQVNHTSKSRRKRGSSAALDNNGPRRNTQRRIDHSDSDSLAAWRHVNEAESQASLGDWASTHSQTHNGFSEDPAEQPESDLNHRNSILASASKNLGDGLEFKGDEEEQEEEAEEILEAAGESSSLEDSPSLEPDLRMSLALSPALSSNSAAMEDEGILAD